MCSESMVNLLMKQTMQSTNLDDCGICDVIMRAGLAPLLMSV